MGLEMDRGSVHVVGRVGKEVVDSALLERGIVHGVVEDLALAGYMLSTRVCEGGD